MSFNGRGSTPFMASSADALGFVFFHAGHGECRTHREAEVVAGTGGE